MIPDWIRVFEAEEEEQESPSPDTYSRPACLMSPQEGTRQPVNPCRLSSFPPGSSSDESVAVGRTKPSDARRDSPLLNAGNSLATSQDESWSLSFIQCAMSPRTRQRDLLKKAERFTLLSRENLMCSETTPRQQASDLVAKTSGRPDHGGVQTGREAPFTINGRDEGKQCNGRLNEDEEKCREMTDEGQRSYDQGKSALDFSSYEETKQRTDTTANKEGLKRALEEHLMKRIERIKRRSGSNNIRGGAGGVGLRALCRLMDFLGDIEEKVTPSGDREEDLQMTLSSASSEQCSPARLTPENVLSSLSKRTSSSMAPGTTIDLSSSSFGSGAGVEESTGQHSSSWDHVHAETPAVSTTKTTETSSSAIEADRRVKKHKLENPLLSLEVSDSEAGENKVNAEKGENEKQRSCVQEEGDLNRGSLSTAFDIVSRQLKGGDDKAGGEREDAKKKRRGQNSSAERHANVTQIREEANAQASLLEPRRLIP